jgi:hypothetical protein
MANNNFNKGFQSLAGSTSAGMNAILWTMMAVNIFMPGGMVQMVQWINSLQLIVHLPLF